MKRRVFAYIEALSEHYPDDDGTAQTIERARTAQSLPQIHDLLCLIDMTY